MIVRDGPLEGLLVIEPPVYRDTRGYFRELWHQARYTRAGVGGPFVQDNACFSHAGALRGLHFQHPRGQGKLFSVVSGEVFDVAVDVRVGSPTFGRWAGFRLSDRNGVQLYIPPGMAHGALALSETAVFTYKCTEVRVESAERVLRWDDPDVGIEWPLTGAPSLSPRDELGAWLRDFAPDTLPQYAPADARDVVATTGA